MPIREPFAQDAFYHVYNRGFKEAKIFYRDSDYKKFIAQMAKYQDMYEDILSVQTRCLLPNHFHLLVKIKSQGLKFADFMMRLELSYAMYFKYHYGMYQGVDNKLPVFEGRYHAKGLDTEEYLLECERYIQNNPVKHQYVECAKDRPWQG